jgi:hypothetical protein
MRFDPLDPGKAWCRDDPLAAASFARTFKTLEYPPA